MGYLGSKAASGAYQVIIANMPPHDTYIETHLGSGAVMSRKPGANRSIGIDMDQAVIDLYRKDNPNTELHQGDALAYLNQFDFSCAGRVLIYADPPYLLSTRTSRHRYKHEYTDDDHRELLAVLRGLSVAGAAVMLSGYPSALYDTILEGWRSVEFQVMTRGGPRTEKLWMSFEAGAAHWATYAGDGFAERQRIKRKAARWAENYKALPPGERLAVLAAMLETKVPHS